MGLLRKGPSTVLEISKFTEINRVTVHVNIENLIEKGLVSQTKSGRGKRRQIIAESPERLTLLVEQEKSRLTRTEVELPAAIKAIYQIIPNVKENTEADIKYYQGKKEVLYIYDEVLKANEVRSYVNDKNAFPEFAMMTDEKFIAAHNKKKNLVIKDLLFKDKEITEYTNKMASGRYFYKFLPDNLKLPAIDYMIFDGKVGIITLTENDAKGFVISSNDYYESAKAIFDFTWESIK
jgi:DNA-binding MarR family transcriptional regulator